MRLEFVHGLIALSWCSMLFVLVDVFDIGTIYLIFFIRGLYIYVLRSTVHMLSLIGVFVSFVFVCLAVVDMLSETNDESLYLKLMSRRFVTRATLLWS